VDYKLIYRLLRGEKDSGLIEKIVVTNILLYCLLTSIITQKIEAFTLRNNKS